MATNRQARAPRRTPAQRRTPRMQNPEPDQIAQWETDGGAIERDNTKVATVTDEFGREVLTFQVEDGMTLSVPDGWALEVV
jgi:hypothetical protein